MSINILKYEYNVLQDILKCTINILQGFRPYFTAMQQKIMGLCHLNASLCAFILFSLITTIRGACFTPDGSASTDLSCSSDASQPSICCRKGYSCTTSNFCIDSANIDPSTGLSASSIYIRGTCTDKTWGSPECGTHCLAGVPNGGELVVDCGGGTYCCTNSTGLGPVGAGCCRNDTIAKFDAGVPSVFAVAGEPGSSSLSAPSSTPTTPSPNESEGLSSSPTSISAATNSPNNGQADSKNNSNRVAIGVGVSLGLLLVAVTAGAIWWIRKLNRRINAVVSESREDALRMAELVSVEKWAEMAHEEGMRRVEMGQAKDIGVELGSTKYGKAVEMP